MAFNIDKIQFKTLDFDSTNTLDGITDFREIVIDEKASNGGDLVIKNTSGDIVRFKNDDNLQIDLDGKLGLTGFVSWGGTGNYYSVVDNDLTLLRTVNGMIDGKEVIGLSGQTIAFSVYDITYVGIDVNGTMVATNSVNESWFASHIGVFEILADATNHLVVFANHPVGTLQGKTGDYIHHTIGSILGHYPGESNEIGADIVRVTTGTGSLASDRQLKIVGNATLYDQGIRTLINDSVGAAISMYFAYTDNLGRWVAYAQQTQFPMVYNNNGVITALSAGNYSIMSVYVTKTDPNNGVTYINVIGNYQYSNSGQATTALSNGIVPKATNALSNMKVALLGYVIIHNSGGGYIHTIDIHKQVINQIYAGGGIGSNASLTTTSVSGFDKILSATDTTVQIALETIDEHNHNAVNIDFDATGNLSSLNVQDALFELQDDVNSINGILDTITSPVLLKGSWDASIGTFPGGGTAITGWTYIITVAGTVDGVQFSINDRILAITDDASTTTYVGNWLKLDYTDQVLSVFNRTGVIVATSGDYSASLITNTPAGSISSIDVQAAINEIDNDLTGHTGDATIHFVDSSVTHNTRSDLQGGTSNEYYHLISTEYNDLQNKILKTSYDTESGSTYTFVISDVNVQKRFTSDIPVIITIPHSTTTDFPIGVILPFKQVGLGQLSVIGDTNVTVNYSTGYKTLTQYSGGYAEKVAQDSWELVGGLTL